MRRLGLALLALSVVMVAAVSANPSFVFLSWALAVAAVVSLARDAESRRAAIAASVALTAAIVLAFVGAGVTLGRGGQVLAATPTFDPTSVLLSLGVAASWWTAGVFVLAYEIPRRRKLALAGAVVVGLGLFVFIGESLALAGLIARPFLGVGGGGLLDLLAIGALLVLASFVRTARELVRPSA
jgi:hypothetical protein